jgi:hypothetical protein
MTADKCMFSQVWQSDARTEATTSSMADTDFIFNYLESEIYSITLNSLMPSTKDISIRLVLFKAWWNPNVIQELR